LGKLRERSERPGLIWDNDDDDDNNNNNNNNNNNIVYDILFVCCGHIELLLDAVHDGL
jgi:hypothetical protein